VSWAVRDAVLALARELGFLAAGVADLAPSRRARELDEWLASGFAGTMRYLHRQAGKRKHPAQIVPGARVAVVVLDNYLPPAPPSPCQEPRSAPPFRPTARIAKYARGRDYHLDLIERLERLAGFLRGRGAAVARAFADAGPVPERELAERAGLGWIGKNTMLIRPGAGSFVFIGSVFTDLDLEPTPPLETDHCGSCTRCLDACPTSALVAPRILDATRCISYHTIESRLPIPEFVRERLDGWAFGCDVCNDVCPWNERFAQPTRRSAYHDRRAVALDDPGFFERMTEAEFAARFADTPLERPGLAGMRRNYRAALHQGPGTGGRGSIGESTDPRPPPPDP
jgi:epoxyqueuosine reductase